MRRPQLVVAAIGLALSAGACGKDSNRDRDAAPVVPATSPTFTTSAAPLSETASPQAMPCDPGFGLPSLRKGCPDPEPATGWLTASHDGLSLAPFRTLSNDAEGEAYALGHALEYPFPNDYFDAPDGGDRPLVLAADTVCTGIIRVGYREPLEDHVVSCDQLVEVATRSPVSVAVWVSDGQVVQASELYRP